MGTSAAEIKFMAQVPYELRRIAEGLDEILKILKETSDATNGEKEGEDGGL